MKAIRCMIPFDERNDRQGQAISADKFLHRSGRVKLPSQMLNVAVRPGARDPTIHSILNPIDRRIDTNRVDISVTVTWWSNWARLRVSGFE